MNQLFSTGGKIKFLFNGIVGKTELAKQVARYLHKDNKKVQDIAL